MLKSYGGWPTGFECQPKAPWFQVSGFWVLGLGVWGLGLTIYKVLLAEETPIMLKNFSYIFQSYLSLPLPKADNGKGNQG